MANNPDICVVLPTFRREKELVDTIKDVLAQSYKNLELLVVDQSDSHEPETEEFLKSIKDKRFRYHRTTPASLPAARNYALKNSHAPIALFLDDDIELNREMVKVHLETMQKMPEVSAVAGRVMQAGFPIRKDVLHFDKYGLTEGVFTATEAAYTNTFPGGNHSIRIEDALRVGGYDTRYYGNAFREESDIAMRMIKAGMKIYYEPKAELLHLAAPRGGTRNKSYVDIQDTAMFYRNELFFTIRMVAKRDLPRALRRKHRIYCSNKPRKRSLLFFAGLVAALWRQVFGHQIITKEVSVK